jgi:energy-coupling factor transporter ATP-binding protein EcfA2
MLNVKRNAALPVAAGAGTVVALLIVRTVANWSSGSLYWIIGAAVCVGAGTWAIILTRGFGSARGAEVILVTGEGGIGKSELTKHLGGDLTNFRRVSFGEYIRFVAGERGVADDLLSLHDLGHNLKRVMGSYQLFAELLRFNGIGTLEHQLLIVDDVYHPDVFETVGRLFVIRRHLHIEYSAEGLRGHYRQKGLTEHQIDRLVTHPIEQAMRRLVAKHPPDKTLKVGESPVADYEMNREDVMQVAKSPQGAAA